ncbi:MAG: monovalent cation/H(+) antiporter subunit G [Solirubrobacteraceae bacterium]
MKVAHVFGSVLLFAGVVLELFAVIGVTAMRSVLDRLHYVGLAGWGAFLIGVAILAQFGFSLLGDKAAATGLLLVGLGPVLVHSTARSLRQRARGDWRTGKPPASGSGLSTGSMGDEGR